jgi:hypothetical protein
MNLDIDNGDELTQEDVRQAKLVDALRLNVGFPVLVEFWNVQREQIIKLGRQAAKTKDSATAAGYWMMLDGFDKAVTIIEKIAARANQDIELKELEKEGEQHADE